MTGVKRLASLAALAAAVAIFGAWTEAGLASSQGGGPVARARDYLQADADHLGLRPDLEDLRLIDVREGLSGHHLRYQQTLAGLPVFGRFVTVSVPKDQRSPVPPLMISRYRPGVAQPMGGPMMMAHEAVRVVSDSVSLASDNLRGGLSAGLVYYPIEEGKAEEYVLAWQITAPTLRPLASWMFILRADNGAMLLEQDLLRFDVGQIFDPNPARSSGRLVPPPSDCDGPANESALSAEYVSQTLRGISAGQDRLIGEFVDLSAPGIAGAYKPAAVADEPSRDYVYGCDDDRFEEVMVYHHIDAVQREIQSLGFSGTSGIIDRPIPAHAHFF